MMQHVQGPPTASLGHGCSCLHPASWSLDPAQVSLPIPDPNPCYLCPGALVGRSMFCCSLQSFSLQTGQSSGHPSLGWPCPTRAELLPLCPGTQYIPAQRLQSLGVTHSLRIGVMSPRKGEAHLRFPLVSDFHLALGSANSVAGPACWELRAVKQRGGEVGQQINSFFVLIPSPVGPGLR